MQWRVYAPGVGSWYTDTEPSVYDLGSNSFRITLLGALPDPMWWGEVAEELAPGQMVFVADRYSIMPGDWFRQ